VLFTSLQEIKAQLEIEPDDLQEDKRLNFWIKLASGLIEEWSDGALTLKQLRTEYYNGTNTFKLLLRHRPVFSDSLRCWFDETGFYGQPSGSFDSTKELTLGSDFGLWIDRDDGRSYRGILLRKNGVWPKTFRRTVGLLSPYVDESYGCVKVQYIGGHTADTLPQHVVTAVMLLVTKIRYIMPLGMPITSDSYEGMNYSFDAKDKNYLFGQCKHLLQNQRNFRF
jgi:hypothetical protein